MKLMAMLISMLMLVSIGIGQRKMTAAERAELNAKADWTAVSRNVSNGKITYVDSRTIFGDKKTGLVIFEVKMSPNVAGYTYATFMGSCLTARYLYTNIFNELGGTLTRVNETSKVGKAEEGTVIWDVLVYACKTLENPPIVPNIEVDNDG